MPIAYRSAGVTIHADDYNRLQEKVQSLLGAGGGIYGIDYGYGQTVHSSQVQSGSMVTAEQLNNLRIDILKLWQHQTIAVFPVNSVDLNDVVQAGSATESLADGENKTYNDYTFAVNQVDTNRLQVNASAMTLVASAATYSFSNWNNFKTHDITITFDDSSHRRFFFNTGGQIRISANLAGSWATGSKPGVWQNLLSSVGTYVFTYPENQTISSAPQILVLKSPIAGGVYSENYYKIIGSAISSNILLFRVIFHDVDVGDQTGIGGGVDENVSGTTVSTASIYHASGSPIDPENSESIVGVRVKSPIVASAQGTVY